MNATLEAAVSVGRSVRNVTFLKYGSNLHFKGTLGYLRVLQGTSGYFRYFQVILGTFSVFKGTSGYFRYFWGL